MPSLARIPCRAPVEARRYLLYILTVKKNVMNKTICCYPRECSARNIGVKAIPTGNIFVFQEGPFLRGLPRKSESKGDFCEPPLFARAAAYSVARPAGMVEATSRT